MCLGTYLPTYMADLWTKCQKIRSIDKWPPSARQLCGSVGKVLVYHVCGHEFESRLKQSISWNIRCGELTSYDVTSETLLAQILNKPMYFFRSNGNFFMFHLHGRFEGCPFLSKVFEVGVQRLPGGMAPKRGNHVSLLQAIFTNRRNNPMQVVCFCCGSGRHFALDVGHIVGPLNYSRCDTKHRHPCTISPFY